MVQLLHKLSVRAVDAREKLLKVIKNPVTNYLPIGAIRVGTSVTAEVVNIDDWVIARPDNEPIVFMFGAHAHGKCAVDWTDTEISVSRYPLSASTAIARLLGAYEKKWAIL
jgi:rRNA small subunit pseudouridine methyltransferase Nep1